MAWLSADTTGVEKGAAIEYGRSFNEKGTTLLKKRLEYRQVQFRRVCFTCPNSGLIVALRERLVLRLYLTSRPAEANNSRPWGLAELSGSKVKARKNPFYYSEHSKENLNRYNRQIQYTTPIESFEDSYT